MSRAVLLLSAFVVLGSGCGRAERDPSQWPIASSELTRHETAVDPGEAAYRRTCIACHMADGKGNGGTTAADLTNVNGLLSQPDDAVRAVIRAGRRGSIGVMPAHAALLSAVELDAVVAYLRRTIAPNVSIREVDAGVDAASP